MSESASVSMSCALASSCSSRRYSAKAAAVGCRRAYSTDRSRNCCEFPTISGSASRCPSSSNRCSAFSSFWRIDAFIFSYSLAAMEPRHLTLAALQLMIGAAALCAMPGPALAATASMRDVEDSNALVMTAEIALQRDDCGRAAANYTVAAQRLADAKLAERATGVALDCGQFQAAERAAARWRQLTPTDPAALRAAMRADLGLYKIDDARSAFESWIKNGGGVNAVKSGRRADDASSSGGAAAPAEDNIADQLGLVASESGVPATLAMLRGAQVTGLQSARGQLALATLALDGWSYREALQYGERALNAGAERATTQLVLARAHAGLGEADQAVAAAGAARSAAPKDQSFAAADVLILLGREREARMTLEGLRDTAAL